MSDTSESTSYEGSDTESTSSEPTSEVSSEDATSQNSSTSDASSASPASESDSGSGNASDSDSEPPKQDPATVIAAATEQVLQANQDVADGKANADDPTIALTGQALQSAADANQKGATTNEARNEVSQMAGLALNEFQQLVGSSKDLLASVSTESGQTGQSHSESSDTESEEDKPEPQTEAKKEEKTEKEEEKKEEKKEEKTEKKEEKKEEKPAKQEKKEEKKEKNEEKKEEKPAKKEKKEEKKEEKPEKKDKKEEKAEKKEEKKKPRTDDSTKSSDAKDIDQIIEEEDAQIEAVYQFNSNPKKNIGALMQYYHKEPTPENIAEVLRTTPGLLGDKIGEYMVRPENEKVMKAYFDVIDMHVDFLEAMRRALSGPFFMPGEAQMIERTMNCFCDSYMAQNPGIFGNSDDPYVLAFALIMLNTDMLKPSVTNKMTEQQFIANTLGSLQASNLSKELLSSMYQSLKNKPLRLAANAENDNFLVMTAPKIKGYLKKKSIGKRSYWKRHYFVFTNSCLYYFKDNSTQAGNDHPLGMIQLVGVKVKGDKQSKLRIQILAQNDSLPYLKFKKGKPDLVPGVTGMLLEAPDDKTREKWLHRLKKSVIISYFQAPLEGETPNVNLTTSDSEGGG